VESHKHPGFCPAGHTEDYNLRAKMMCKHETCRPLTNSQYGLPWCAYHLILLDLFELASIVLPEPLLVSHWYCGTLPYHLPPNIPVAPLLFPRRCSLPSSCSWDVSSRALYHCLSPDLSTSPCPCLDLNPSRRRIFNFIRLRVAAMGLF